MRQLEETLHLLAGQDAGIDPGALIDRIERILSEEGVPVVPSNRKRVTRPRETKRYRPWNSGWAFGAAMIAVVTAIAVPVWFLRGTGSTGDMAEIDLGPVPVTVTELLSFEGAGAGEGITVAWSPDGTTLVTSDEQDAKVWDATTGEGLLAILANGGFGSSKAAFSPDGTRIATTAGIFDAVTGERILELDEFLAWSPDSTRIVAGGAWAWAGIFDAVTGDPLLSLAPPPCRGFIQAGAFSRDGTRVATTCGTGIMIWDATAGGRGLNLSYGTGAIVNDLSWSPDGTRIAIASEHAKEVRVRAVSMGGEPPTLTREDEGVPLTLAGHDGGTYAIEWSPDGSRIATAGGDRTVRIWGADSGHEVATLTGFGATVTDVAWSPDGASLATVTENGTVKVWTVTAGR